MKPRDPRLETRSAPPVYRPQPQFRPVQGKMAGMVPSPSGSAPPVYKPSPAIAAHPNRYPAIVQLSKKSQEKKEEQKKGKKKAESKLQSRTDRNLNRLGQYQTEDKKRQGERQEKVKELSKQGKNLAHGFGNEQSGKSGKFHQYMKDVNAKGPEKKMTSQEEEFTPSKEKKGTDLQLGGPSVSVRDVRTKAAKVANFRKTREDGVKDYADYCQRNLGTSFGRDKYEKWANEWADTQDWEEPLIPSEHPTKEFEEKEDPDSDNGGGGFGLGFGGPNQEVLVG